MSVENVLCGPMVERIGWTLIHFLWQGAALAVMLSAELVLLRRSKANVRYIAACLTLALMVFVPCVTMFMVPVSEFERAADISLTSSSFETGLAEVAEVSRPKSTEPISPKDVAAPVVSVSSSYSWRERGNAILEPVLPYVVLGWLVGVFGLSVWHLGGWTQLQRLRRKMVRQVGPPWQSRVKELGELLGIRRAVQLVESALVRVPTVVGWVRPVILLPASALTGLTGEELEAILAHELAHIKRFDYLVNMLQTAVEILGFYHPAVWWVSHKIRVERENCCDDLAVSVSGDRVRYAKALTLLEEIRGGHAGLAVAASGVSLFGRIRRLVGTASRENRRCSWVPAIVVVLLIVALAIPTAVALSGRRNKRSHVEVEGSGIFKMTEGANVLPTGWRLDYDSGHIPGEEGMYWRSGMAFNLAELRVRPKPVDPHDLGWKEEEYDFRVRSLKRDYAGELGVARGELDDAHLTLKPDKYLITYTRRRGRHPDNFRMHWGKFLLDLSRPGMYELKFRPKLGTGEISGSLGGCYALNFAKIGDGPRLAGFAYQSPPKRYVLDGLPAGRYALSAVRQLQGDNVSVSRAEATIKDGEKVVVDMDAPAAGDCSLSGKILGRLSKPRKDSWPEFEWFVLIRKPDSAPVVTADAYEALTMDTLYVVRGENIVEETQEEARYTIEGIAAGEYTVTVIENDLSAGALISRQQSRPLRVGAGEAGLLDFDLRKSERGALGVGSAESFSESRFAATLSNGVTVELIGVCEHPSEGKQWWRPDGRALGVAPYDKVGGKVFPDENERACEFAVRLDGLPTGPISTKMKTDPSGSATAGGSSAPKKAGRYMRDFRWMAASLEKKWKSCTVGFGIAAGNWKTIATREPGKRPGQWGSSLLGVTEGNIAFSDAVGLDGQTQVTVTHDILEKDFRIVAVGQTGREYTASQSDSSATDSFNQVTLSFKLALDDVRGFRVQVRPYEWVEFKNVSLKPGVKTDVEVKVRGARAEKEDKEVLVLEVPRALTEGKVEKTKREEIAEKIVVLEGHRVGVTKDLQWAGGEGARKVAGELFEQLCKKLHVEKSRNNFPEAAQIYERLLYHPEQERRGYWITNRQIQEELTEEEKAIVLATFEGGKITLKDWFETLHGMSPVSRPKELNTAKGVEGLLNRALVRAILVGEAKRRDGRLSRERIAAKLENVEKQRVRVQGDLRAAEQALEEVRNRWGFYDLEERSYPHPVTQRLIRLERQRDDCLLEIAQLRAKINNLEEQADSPEGKANLKKARGDLIVLISKLEELQKMRDEAAAKKRDLDLARVQYKQRASIRDERKRMLDSIKSQIEKLKILHDDPETPERAG